MLTQRARDAEPLHAAGRPAARDRGRASSSWPWPRSSAPTSCPSRPSRSPRASWPPATSSPRARSTSRARSRPTRPGPRPAPPSPPQYDFTTRERDRHRGRPAAGLRGPRRADRHHVLGRPQRRRAQVAPPDGRPGSVRTGQDDAGRARRGARWAAVRTEAARVLDATLRTELRDTEVADTRTRLAGRMAGGLDEAAADAGLRAHRPAGRPQFLVQQTTLTDTRPRTKAAEAVVPVPVTIRQGEVIVRNGTPLTATDIEKIDALGLRQTAPDVASFGGWFLLAVLVVGMLLAWIWRFRPGLWHRDNVLDPDRPAGRRCDPGAQAHCRPADPAVLPADGGDRDPPGDPARRIDGDHRHRDRGRSSVAR